MSRVIFETESMQVVAFCGKEGDASVSFCISDKQESLTADKVKRLIKALSERRKKR